jgi:hypothetical protein
MPFGISESAIAKAYGPTDLSGVYKSLQAGINKIAKEEQLYRQQNLKDYMQVSSKLAETSKGARSEDTPEILNHINNWKTYTKLRDAEPNLIQKDPKKWQEYQSKIDDEYASAINLSKESNEFKTEYKNFGQEITNNAHRYKGDAIATWDKVNKMPLSEIKKQGLDSREKYLSLTPEIEKVYDAFDKSATARAEKLGKVETKGTGLETRERQIKYKNVPEYGTYVDLAQNTLSKFGKDVRGKQNYAYTILDNADDFDKQVKQFKDNMESASPDMLEAMHISKDMSKDLYITKRLMDEIKDGKPVQSVANQYLAMKKFNEQFRGVSVDDQGFKIKDEVQKAKLGKKMSFENSMDTWRSKLKEKGFGTPETFDVSPVFNTISSGGETGQKQTKELISTLNNSPLIDANTTMITTGKNIVGTKNDKYGNYTNSDKVLNALKKTQKNVNLTDTKSVANAMNEQNLTSGLLNVNINPRSIESGKVLAFSWYDDKSGLTKTAFLDTQDTESANQLNKLIKKKIDTRKQLAAAAAGLMSDVEGAFNDIK